MILRPSPSGLSGTTTSDVLVLGAGPAGCAAALQARRQGLSVLLVEARKADRPEPGETLHPGIEPLFERLGVWPAVLRADFPRHTGIWVASKGGEFNYQPYGASEGIAWRGIQADRLRLRAILLDAATCAGTTVIRGHVPTAPLAQSGRLRGIVADGIEVHARWTIDATGRASWLVRHLDLKIVRRSPKIIARYGWCAIQRAEGDGNPRFAVNGHGWRWRASVGRQRLAWVDAEVAAAGANAQPGIDVSWRVVEDAAGPGYFIVGDAGSVLDPASSHGVMRGLMTAMMAVSLIGKVLREDLDENAAAAFYARWSRTWFEKDYNALLALYHQHLHPSVMAHFTNSSAAP